MVASEGHHLSNVNKKVNFMTNGPNVNSSPPGSTANEVPKSERETLLLHNAAERSHRDYLASSEAIRLATNLLILINGGAATAVLGYLGNSKGQGTLPRGLLVGACLSIFVYAFGVIFGLYSIKFVGDSYGSFGYSWRQYLEGRISVQELFEKEGHNRSRWLNVSFFVSSFCFIASSVFLALAFAFLS